MEKLKNKVSIVTGAGSGMGKAIALLFASEGSRVVATDINVSRLDDLKNEIKNTGYMYSKSGIRCNAIAPGAVNTTIGDTIDFTKLTPLINERIMPGMALNPRSGE